MYGPLPCATKRLLRMQGDRAVGCHSLRSGRVEVGDIGCVAEGALFMTTFNYDEAHTQSASNLALGEFP